MIYKLDKIDQTNYYLKITAISEEDKSIVNVRFGSSLERPRLKFLTLTNFPLKKGEVTAMFACFSNTSVINTAGKITVVVLDKNDAEIASLYYSGEISSTEMAVKKEFMADKDYTYFKLKAEVYDSKDALVDKYEGVYDCKDIPFNNKCKEIETVVPIRPISTPDGSRNIPIVISGATLFILLIPIIILIRRKSRAQQY